MLQCSNRGHCRDQKPACQALPFAVTQKDDDAVVVIRRYGNRRLYDTRASAYVNLADVRNLVREGKKIRVVDANTEEDVTRRVLTQIVLEASEEEGEKGLPLDLLYELTRASDRAFRDFLDWYLKSSHEVYERLQERWQADARKRWGDARPAFEAWAQLWDPRQVAASLAQLLSPFERRPGGPAGRRARKTTSPPATGSGAPRAANPAPAAGDRRKRARRAPPPPRPVGAPPRERAARATASQSPSRRSSRRRRQTTPPVTATRDRVVERFQHLYGRTPDLVVRAPGRVSLLGGHVDYNEGWVLPGAIDRAVWLAAGRGAEPHLRASSLELGDADPVSLDPVRGPSAAKEAGRGGWIEYAAGVAWALAAAGHSVAPLDAVVGSDLPTGRGLSSSAALEVAFLLAWRELGGLAIDELEGARPVPARRERVRRRAVGDHGSVRESRRPARSRRSARLPHARVGAPAASRGYRDPDRRQRCAPAVDRRSAQRSSLRMRGGAAAPARAPPRPARATRRRSRDARRRGRPTRQRCGAARFTWSRSASAFSAAPSFCVAPTLPASVAMQPHSAPSCAPRTAARATSIR